MAKKQVKKLTPKKIGKSTITEVISTQVVVASLEKRAEPSFKVLEKITKVTKDNFEVVASNIKAIKEIDKIAKAEEASMIDPIKLSIKRIEQFFKPFHTRVKDAELENKQLLEDYVNASTKAIAKVEEDFKNGSIKKVATYAEKTASFQISNGGSAQTRKISKLLIIDVKKIPREFLVPDESAIVAAFKDGKIVAGCEYRKVNSIAI